MIEAFLMMKFEFYQSNSVFSFEMHEIVLVFRFIKGSNFEMHTTPMVSRQHREASSTTQIPLAT